MGWSILTDEAQRTLVRAALRGAGGRLSATDARAALDWAAWVLMEGGRHQRDRLAAVLRGDADLAVVWSDAGPVVCLTGGRVAA